MSKHVALLSGFFIVLVVVLGLYVARKVNTLAMRRADAERRAAEALAEMTRLSQELRTRPLEAEAVSLPPGERLKRQYPGWRATQSNVSVEET